MPLTANSDLTTVDGIELTQFASRDVETGEETTKWKVDHENLDRACQGDTPQEALDIFAECIAKDEGKLAIDLADLE